MYINSRNGIADNGLRSAGVDFDVALSYGLQYGSRIEGGLVHGCIAVHGTDPKELDARVMAGEEKSVGVL